jgi:predicted site-specific integrase-resolvase
MIACLEMTLEELLSQYVSAPQAAKMLRVSRQRVAVLCRRGQLAGAVLAYGRWWIPRDEVVARTKSSRRRKSRREQG